MEKKIDGKLPGGFEDGTFSEVYDASRLAYAKLAALEAAQQKCPETMSIVVVFENGYLQHVFVGSHAMNM